MQPEIFSKNIGFTRKLINLTQEQIAKLLGVSATTIINWEKGRIKYSSDVKSRGYFHKLCQHPNFPKEITVDDFLTKDLLEHFSEDSSRIATDNFSIEEVSGDVGVDISTDTCTVPPSTVETLPVGLQEFINDELEMAVANLTSKEIKALVQLKPSWKASKDFYRLALGDLRRSQKHLKCKATAADHHKKN